MLTPRPVIIEDKLNANLVFFDATDRSDGILLVSQQLW